MPPSPGDTSTGARRAQVWENSPKEADLTNQFSEQKAGEVTQASNMHTFILQMK